MRISMKKEPNDVCSCCDDMRFDKLRDRYFCNRYTMTPLAVAYHKCGIRSPIMCNQCLNENGKTEPKLDHIVRIEQPTKDTEAWKF